jgi:phosphoglycerate kinase
MRYVDQLDVEGRRVLLRVDLNVPLHDGSVEDDTRILAVLPTINYILDNGGMAIVMSHLDRPGGKRVAGLSLRPVAERLSEILATEVTFVDEIVGPAATSAAERMRPGSIVMLENLRFDKGEESNDEAFSKSLASLADIYVDDAFANAHRSHASNVGVTRHMEECCGGLLMKRELKALEGALESPKRPLVVAIGGAKVSSKIDVLENLARVADRLLLGGAMAFPFLRAQGLEVGDERFDGAAEEKARRILESDAAKALVIPEDFVISTMDGGVETVAVSRMPDGAQPLDIGPRTIEQFVNEIKGAGTIVWNGPMGMFEKEEFSAGTRSIAKAIADASAFSLAGGGDTGSAVDRYELRQRISYVSTGGGAFLEKLAGRQLPGIEALEDPEFIRS